MSMEYYPVEGIGVILNENLISYCLNELVEGRMSKDDFDFSFGNLDSILESMQIEFNDLKSLEDNQLKELFLLIKDDMRTNDSNCTYIDSSDNSGYVYPYKKKTDAFDWDSDVCDDNVLIIDLNYNCGLFRKPFKSVDDLKKEVSQVITIPNGYDILDNIVYYKAVFYG